MHRKIVPSILVVMLLLPTTVAVVSGKEPVIRSCVVAETLDAAGYIYIRCKERGTDIWVATMRTSLRNGEQIAFVDTPPMMNFTSKELKRTFPQVMFVTELGRNGARPTIKSEPEPKGYAKASPYEEEPLYTGTDDSGSLVFTDDPSKMASKSVTAKRRFRPVQNLTVQENYNATDRTLIRIQEKVLNAYCSYDMKSLKTLTAVQYWPTVQEGLDHEGANAPSFFRNFCLTTFTVDTTIRQHSETSQMDGKKYLLADLSFTGARIVHHDGEEADMNCSSTFLKEKSGWKYIDMICGASK